MSSSSPQLIACAAQIVFLTLMIAQYSIEAVSFYAFSEVGVRPGRGINLAESSVVSLDGRQREESGRHAG